MKTFKSFKSNIQESEQSFDVAFKTFLENVQKMINDHFSKNYPNLKPDIIGYDNGQKYIRVWKMSQSTSKSAYCFIDKSTGDIYKGASWKTPAKGIRGNIFDSNGGMKAVNPFGAVYFSR